MFEQQFSTLETLHNRTAKSIATYYTALNSTELDKLDLIEAALANLDILLMYIIQVRFEIRQSLSSLPASNKHSAYDCLEELRVIQETAKTVSYNLTAAMHSLRDLNKVNLQ